MCLKCKAFAHTLKLSTAGTKSTLKNLLISKRSVMRAKFGSPLSIPYRLPISKLMATRFGEESIEKMVDWCLMHVPSLSNPAVLEVGSGNGALLFALAEAGYSQKLLIGIDYSDDAVKLSTKISATRNATEIMFSVCDFLQEDPSPLSSLEHSKVPSCWDLVLDKGTYDAIALGSKDPSGRSPAGAYPHRLCRLLKPGGLFLITCTNNALNNLQMP